jgi:hypothetical protein
MIRLGQNSRASSCMESLAWNTLLWGHTVPYTYLWEKGIELVQNPRVYSCIANLAARCWASGPYGSRCQSGGTSWPAKFKAYTVRNIVYTVQSTPPPLNRAHISGRQTPGLTRGSPPHLLYKRGMNPGLNPGFGVLRCGLREISPNSDLFTQCPNP